MAKKVYFNTAFSLSMVTAPFNIEGVLVTEDEAHEFLTQEGLENVANPNHANTLAALSQKLGFDLRDASGARVSLQSGDQVLVGQVRFPPTVPRETTEYTQEQLALGTFEFLLVTVK